MGLEVDASRTFWKHAQPGETASDRRRRAQQEQWFPALSEARVRYLLLGLDKRFPAHVLPALKRWSPAPERQAPLICHWHLQWSDPLYLDFTSGFLVGAWARSDRGLTVSDADAWLVERGTHGGWSPSTRRRLASGLLAAASVAGFLRGQARKKEPCAVTVDERCLAYLGELRELCQTSRPLPPEELMLSGTVSAV